MGANRLLVCSFYFYGNTAQRLCVYCAVRFFVRLYNEDDASPAWHAIASYDQVILSQLIRYRSEIYAPEKLCQAVNIVPHHAVEICAEERHSLVLFSVSPEKANEPGI